MKVGRVGVEFGLLNDLTLPPVVQGHGLLYLEGCGVLGRANSPPCPFFCSKKSLVCAFLPFGILPRRLRQGDIGRELFAFSVLSSFQNSSSSHEATLGHAMSFLRNCYKQFLECLFCPFIPPFLFHPFWCLH